MGSWKGTALALRRTEEGPQKISTHRTIASLENDSPLAALLSCALRETIFFADPDTLNTLHKYIAAYARQGLQASARCSNSRALPRESARSNPRSLDGNASGSPRARIATYCAVHLPMPGISQRRVRNTSLSITPSNLILPEQTARASARMVSARPPVNPTSTGLGVARISGVGKR